LKTLQSGSEDLADGLVTLKDGSQKMVNGLSDLKDGSQKLNNGLSTASDGSKELYDKLNDGYTKAKDQVEDAKIAKEKPMISDPVGVTEQKTDPVSSYGTGFTPYFIPLALWVGSMAIFFVLQPLSTKDAAKFSRWGLLKEILMRYAVFAVIAVFQSLVQNWVLMKALGLSPNHLELFFSFTILLGLLDVAIIECLTFLLDRGGIFIAVILLMLQLTSSAGAFPRETMPAFFTTIAPYLPMTYAVNELRDIISGSTVNLDGVVAGFIIAIAACLLITYILKYLAARAYTHVQETVLPNGGILKPQFAFSTPATSFSSASFAPKSRRLHPAQSFNSRLHNLHDKRKANMKAIREQLAKVGKSSAHKKDTKTNQPDGMKQG
jgi:putative membrane protein